MMSLLKPLGSPPRSRTTMPALCVICLFATAAPAHAVQLVTAQEAALPVDTPLPLIQRGSPVRRPSVTVVSPAPNAGAVKSPLSLKLKLEAHGGSKIDRDSIALTYMKTPEINITQRIAPYIHDDGIEIPDAEVPPGVHEFRIQVKDKNDNLAAVEFRIEVRQ